MPRDGSGAFLAGTSGVVWQKQGQIFKHTFQEPTAILQQGRTQSCCHLDELIRISSPAIVRGERIFSWK